MQKYKTYRMVVIMATEKLAFAELAGLLEKAEIAPAVLLAGHTGAPEGSEAWESAIPYPTYAAVEEAGLLLRRDPDIRLARQPIPPETIQRIPARDIAARSLLQIVNDSIDRRHSKEAFISPRGGRYGICDLNERFFACTINFAATEESFLDNGVPSVSKHDGYQIITGREDHPILLRKRRGPQCALSLEPITINGVLYPVGSIMRYDLTRDWDPHQDRYVATPLHDAQQEVVSASEIGRIGFLRLSAFTLDVSERHIFPLQPVDFSPLHPNERDMFRLSFSEIYGIVQDAVQRQLTAHV